MQHNLNGFAQIVIWALFFATSVYGHVAFKLASAPGERFRLLEVLFSFWGVTASLAWILSGIFWLMVLSKSYLLTANSISALRYVLVAAAAVLFFKEELGGRQILGTLLVMTGIYYVAR